MIKYFVVLHAFLGRISGGGSSPMGEVSGPFGTREAAEAALISALGSGRFAKGEIEAE